MCSHTFTLLWSRKTFVIIETFQLSLHVFKCAFHPKTLIFLVRASSCFSYFFVIHILVLAFPHDLFCYPFTSRLLLIFYITAFSKLNGKFVNPFSQSNLLFVKCFHRAKCSIVYTCVLSSLDVSSLFIATFIPIFVIFMRWHYFSRASWASSQSTPDYESLQTLFHIYRVIKKYLQICGGLLTPNKHISENALFVKYIKTSLLDIVSCQKVNELKNQYNV